MRNHKDSVSCPGSKLKVNITDVLKREGYINDYQIHSDGPRSVLTIDLKYGPEGEDVISEIQRFSKPGCRRYRGVDGLPRARGGLGIAVVSTSQGVFSDRECRQKRLGGEVLCTVE